MKKYLILLLFSLFQILNCEELGGIKVAINDEFINSALYNFENEIKIFLQGVRLEDREHLSNMVFGIPNFSVDKINLFFGEDGLINIKLNNLEPFLTGKVNYKIIKKFSNNFKVTLENFSLNAKIRIESIEFEPAKYRPDAEFVGDPDINFDVDFEIDGILGDIVEEILNFAGDFGKKYIMPIIRTKFGEMLVSIFNSLPTEAQIGEYWIDYTLASPIQLRNKFIEINSYALIFSKEYPETQNKTRYQLCTFPDRTTNQFQLFVSEYSLNSAAYTYLIANKINNLLSYNISMNFLNVMFPEISKMFSVKMAEISFDPNPESNVKLTEDYMNIELPGKFYIKIEGMEAPIFISELYLNIKAQAKIEYGPKITAKIDELTGEIGNIFVNEASPATKEKIQSGFDLIKIALLPLMNEYIKKYVIIPFPTVMGVTFTDIEAQHKNGYLLINLNISN